MVVAKGSYAVYEVLFVSLILGAVSVPTGLAGTLTGLNQSVPAATPLGLESDFASRVVEAITEVEGGARVGLNAWSPTLPPSSEGLQGLFALDEAFIGEQRQVTGDLIILARESITIGAPLTAVQRSGPNGGVSIALISMGSLEVSADISAGDGGTYGITRENDAGRPGVPGGHLILIAREKTILTIVSANATITGGRGGDGQGVARLGSFDRADARSFGGVGGQGGNVVLGLAATALGHLSKPGDGGAGGTAFAAGHEATVAGTDGGNATAAGGPGGNGGQALLFSSLPPLFAALGSSMAQSAECDADPVDHTGSPGTGDGGHGEPGDAVPDPGGNSCQGGNAGSDAKAASGASGGNGGEATATGGRGADGNLRGGNGGAAAAVGGAGGIGGSGANGTAGTNTAATGGCHAFNSAKAGTGQEGGNGGSGGSGGGAGALGGAGGDTLSPFGYNAGQGGSANAGGGQGVSGERGGDGGPGGSGVCNGAADNGDGGDGGAGGLGGDGGNGGSCTYMEGPPGASKVTGGRGWTGFARGNPGGFGIGNSGGKPGIPGPGEKSGELGGRPDPPRGQDGTHGTCEIGPPDFMLLAEGITDGALGLIDVACSELNECSTDPCDYVLDGENCPPSTELCDYNDDLPGRCGNPTPSTDPCDYSVFQVDSDGDPETPPECTFPPSTEACDYPMFQEDPDGDPETPPECTFPPEVSTEPCDYLEPGNPDCEFPPEVSTEPCDYLEPENPDCEFPPEVSTEPCDYLEPGNPDCEFPPDVPTDPCELPLLEGEDCEFPPDVPVGELIADAEDCLDLTTPDAPRDEAQCPLDCITNGPCDDESQAGGQSEPESANETSALNPGDAEGDSAPSENSTAGTSEESEAAEPTTQSSEEPTSDATAADSESGASNPDPAPESTSEAGEDPSSASANASEETPPTSESSNNATESGYDQSTQGAATEAESPG